MVWSMCTIFERKAVVRLQRYGVEAAKRGPSAYYKNFQEGASKSTRAIKMYA